MISLGSLTNLGARRAEVQVKLFGGGDVLLVSDLPSLKPTVGKTELRIRPRSSAERGS